MHLGGAVKAVMGAQNMGMGMGMQQPAMVPGMGTMGGVMPMAGQVRSEFQLGVPCQFFSWI